MEPTLEELAGQLYGTMQTPDPMAPSLEVTPAPVMHNGDYSAAPIQSDPVNFQPKTFDEWDNPIAMPQALPPGIGKQSMGVKQSESGYSSAKAAEIERGPYGSGALGKVEKRVQGEMDARYAPHKRELAGSMQEQRFAYDEQSQAETAQALALGQGKAEIASLQKRGADQILATHQAGRAAASKAKNEYRARLAAIPEVNPNALWDEAGPGGQAMMGAAAFVHEMLNVKGIKTSAMDTINSAIRNKIDAQIANIKKAEFVASGFKDLYDQTVAESASDQEVRAKMHGYMLKSLEAQVDATMAPYDANVAKAKWGVAKAKLREEQVKTIMEVDKHVDDAVQARVATETSRLNALTAASTARRGQDIDRQIAADRLKAETAKAKAPKPKLYIRDGETGKAVAQLVEGLPEKMQSAVIEKASKFYGADQAMLRLQELERKLDPQFDGFVGTRFAEKDAREYEAISKQLAHSMLAAMGERATDKDVADFMAGLKVDTTFTNGGVSQILGSTHKRMHDELDGIMLQATEPIPDGEAPSPRDVNNNGMYMGSKTAADKAMRGTDVVTVTAADALVKKARSPDATKAMLPKDSDTDGNEYEGFTKPLWGAYSKENPGTEVDNPYASMSPALKNLPTQGFDAVRELAEDAYAGDEAAKRALYQLAKESPTTATDSEFTTDANVQSYAKWFVTKIEGNSQKAYGVNN